MNRHHLSDSLDDPGTENYQFQLEIREKAVKCAIAFIQTHYPQCYVSKRRRKRKL